MDITLIKILNGLMYYLTQNTVNCIYLGGEEAISFVISLLSVVGIILLIHYTVINFNIKAFGLGSLPIFLIKGKGSLGVAYQEFKYNQEMIKKQIKSLNERKKKRGNLMDKEISELDYLKDSEKKIEGKLSKITNLLTSDTVVDKILVIITPFRVLIGFILLLTTMFIVVSLLITSVDKLLNSKCGVNCGFLLENRVYDNYLDQALIFLSKYHVDFIFFLFINIYVYICTLYGFAKIGVNIFCFSIFEIKKKNSLPHALLIGASLISIMILAFLMEILTLAPQYSTFGNQVTASNEKCSLSSINKYSDKICIMSNISSFYNKISLSLPFFSTIFYFCNWAFIIVTIFSIIHSAFFKEEDPFEDIGDIDTEEIIEFNTENNFL